MSARRSRRPGLNSYDQEAYFRQHYLWTKSAMTDRTIDAWEFCYRHRMPYLLIIQPRTYCTLEIDVRPAGGEMTLPMYQQLRAWAYQALEGSRARRKEVNITPRGGTVTGLEPTRAKELARKYWAHLAERMEDAS